MDERERIDIGKADPEQQVYDVQLEIVKENNAFSLKRLTLWFAAVCIFSTTVLALLLVALDAFGVATVKPDVASKAWSFVSALSMMAAGYVFAKSGSSD